jgi:hypothetical protein
MKNKYSILGVLKLLISFSLFITPSSAIKNPDYIEVIVPGEAIFFPFDLTQNNILKIEFEVTDGGNKDVDFYILDSENYDKWNNSESFTYLVFRNRALYANINFIVPNNGTFYVIFSNSFSIITSKTVEIDFTINPESINGVDFPLALVSLILIISIGVIVVLITLIIKYNRKKAPKELFINKNQEKIIEVQDNQISEKFFCQLCGEEILDEEGEYCSKCGGALK